MHQGGFQKSIIGLVALISVLGFGVHVGQAATSTFSLDQYGYGQSLRLSGTNAESFVTIPVSPGLSPAELRFQIIPTPNIGEGFIAVEYKGRLVASLPFSSKKQEVVFPIAGLPVEDGKLTVSLKAVMVSNDTEACSALKARWVDVSDLNVVMEGEPKDPTTVKDFFPTTLRRLVIYTQENPSEERLTAAFNIAARVQRKVGGKAVDVVLRAARAPDVGVEGAMERSVILTSDLTLQKPSINLISLNTGAPVLRIASPADRWQEAIETLFESPAAPLLIASSISTEVIEKPRVNSALDIITFTKLGYPLTRLQGSGEIRTTFRFSQASFGSPIRSSKVVISGVSSVLQKGGIATLATFFNDHLVDSYALSEDGERFRRTIDLSDEYLQRDNVLDVVANYTPPGGNCRIGLHNVVVDIDGGSEIRASSSPVFDPQFDKFPQALLPAFDVFVDQKDPRTWDAAARLITLWQQLSTKPLKPEVHWVTSAATIRRNSVFVVAQPIVLPKMTHMLEPSVAALSASEMTQKISLSGRFALLQTFLEDTFPVIVLSTSYWPEGLRRLTGTLLDGDGWYETTGNVFVVNESGDKAFTEVSALKQLPLQYGIWGTGEALTKSQRFWYAFLGLSGSFLLIGMAIVFGYSYRRRHRQEFETREHPSAVPLITSRPKQPSRARRTH